MYGPCSQSPAIMSRNTPMYSAWNRTNAPSAPPPVLTCSTHCVAAVSDAATPPSPPPCFENTMAAVQHTAAKNATLTVEPLMVDNSDMASGTSADAEAAPSVPPPGARCWCWCWCWW